MYEYDDDDNWSTSWNTEIDPEDEKIIKEAKKRFNLCVNWEAEARRRYEEDIKFANGDSYNNYQWPFEIYNDRIEGDRPCLTVNKVQQHNLMVINDAKQNKPGVNIRPVGDEASFEAAQIFQEVVHHIEYISSAENVYDSATVTQVEGGIGYWRVMTDYMSPRSFDQEIYIRRIKDPRSVYLDPYITELDGSDSNFGFVFEDKSREDFKIEYPKFGFIGNNGVLGNRTDNWITENNVRICEYYRKNKKNKKLVTFIIPQTNEQILGIIDELEDTKQLLAKEIKKNKQLRQEYQYQEREVVVDDIEWFKIAGDHIIDSKPWLGESIPIVRLVGTETVIDGILDRKGHTRALIDPQRIYNYTTSANVEYGALQTKSPWLAPSAAIEGYEEYYKTANTINHSYLPYNHMGDDGQEIPPPSRPQAPQSSPAYVQQMQIAQQEMMMASGQYQAQFGEQENAKSGIAINARQRQGDRATYHFIDNLAIAIRRTGKILIDLIPKVYDTKRIMQMEAKDGTILNVNIDPNAQQGLQQLPPQPGQPLPIDNGQQIKFYVFNPNIGIFDIQSDTGPSFATRRQEAFNALTEIAKTNKEFMNIGGDLLWKVADFPESQILAQRWRKIIPPNITGDGPDPKTEQAMHAASDKIEQLLAIIAKQAKDLADKEKELDIKSYDVETKRKSASADASRLDYDAETKRLVALGNSGPGISVEQIQPLVAQIVRGMLNAGEPGSAAEHNIVPVSAEQLGQEQTTLQPQQGEGAPTPQPKQADEEPPVPGSRKAKDGNWYVPNPNIPGKFMKVEVGA